MPLIASAIKSKFKKTIYNGLKREFSAASAKGDGFPAVADEFWLKLASAISDIAMDMVEEITTKAQVVPGQAVMIPATSAPGTPSAGQTVAPGKIL